MFCKTVVLAVFVVGIFAGTLDPQMVYNSDYARVMCELVKAEDKVDDVATAINAYKNCTSGLGDLEQLNKDITEAMPNGRAAITAALKKYTAKAPQLKICAHALADGVKPCLNNSTKELLTYFKNATDQIIDFLSYNDGERVAIFYSEQGPQCLAAKNLEIKTCMESNPAAVAITRTDPAVGPSISERCGYDDAIHNCTMSALNGCANPTPLRNLLESLFTTLLKSSPCNDALPVITLSTKN